MRRTSILGAMLATSLMLGAAGCDDGEVVEEEIDRAASSLRTSEQGVRVGVQPSSERMAPESSSGETLERGVEANEPDPSPAPEVTATRAIDTAERQPELEAGSTAGSFVPGGAVVGAAVNGTGSTDRGGE